MLEKTNFNLGFLKTIVEVVSETSVLQVHGTLFTVRSNATAAQTSHTESLPRIAQVIVRYTFCYKFVN